MKVIGLTGGIATGKSTVASLLRAKGLVVLDLDQMAREVMAPEQTTLKKVVAAFGEEILDSSGKLDRTKLGAIIFADPKQRKKLDAITHPPLLRRLALHLILLFFRGEDAVVLDAPLLIESGLYRVVNCVVVVSVPEDVQLARLMNRDSIAEEDAWRKMTSQISLAQKVKLADYVIDNAGALAHTQEQVDQLVAALQRRPTVLTRLNVFILATGLCFGLYLLLRCIWQQF